MPDPNAQKFGQQMYDRLNRGATLDKSAAAPSPSPSPSMSAEAKQDQDDLAAHNAMLESAMKSGSTGDEARKKVAEEVAKQRMNSSYGR